MLQNGLETVDAKGMENKNAIMKEGATDHLRPEHTLCQLRRLPAVGSNQVRPNGLPGCKCDELSPYYKHRSEPLNRNSDTNGLVSRSPKMLRDAQHPETVAGSLNSPKKEKCSAETKPPKEQQSFVPPQGMDTGQYPEGLFYQYYPNLNKDYTFDLLPLPFMERLKYQGMRTMSMENEDVEKKWKNFLYNLPNSEFQSTNYPEDKFWRWKKYLRNLPDESRNDFRYKMQVGPKYDDVGRLPIAGKDLQTFREIKPKSNTINSQYFLKKGDGTRKK